MRQAKIATLFTLIVLLAGCESGQKKVSRLQSAYDAVDAQYRKDCDDSWSSSDPQQAAKVLHGQSMSAAENAAFQQREKERANRIAGPHCQEIDSKRKQLSGELLAAQNSLTH
jgi:hypothetical protein